MEYAEYLVSVKFRQIPFSYSQEESKMWNLYRRTDYLQRVTLIVNLSLRIMCTKHTLSLIKIKMTPIQANEKNYYLDIA